MVVAKEIMGLVPGFMALGLVGHTVKTIPKDWGPRGVSKVDTKKMFGGFAGIMIGVPLIGATSGMISKL